MAVLVLVVADFRAQFPAYQSATTYPNSTIQMYFDMAAEYISTNNTGNMKDGARLLALYLMTAHIIFLADLVKSGTVQGGVLTSASQGSVSAGFAPPPVKNQLDYYLSRSVYGQQLLGLLQVKKAFGSYIGGSGTAARSIRNSDGSFG